MSADCPHAEVLVDYDHPAGTIEGVAVADLQASDPARTRQVIVLCNPRCKACGRQLSRQELKERTRRGGDLFDPRFKWG